MQSFAEQLAECLFEDLYPIHQKLVGCILHRDPGLRQVLHGVARYFQIGFETLLGYTMIAKAVEGGRRNGVDCVGSDELFHV